MVKLFLGTRFSREKFFATTFGGKMKKSIKSIISLALLLTLSVTLLCSCALRLTEAEIKEVLADTEGTLTITEGDANDVMAFEYLLTDVNAKELVNKNYTREAVGIMRDNALNLSYAQFKACKAFLAIVAINSLVNDDNASYNSEAYIESVLEVISEGRKLKDNGWTIRATVDVEADSITIYAKR